jgi:hypothetical protein
MPEPPAALAIVGSAMQRRIDEIAQRIVERIQRDIAVYGSQTYVDTAALREAAVANVEYLLRTDPLPEGADLAAARRTGLQRGRVGAPLLELLAGFRIGFAVFWEVLAAEAIASGAITDHELAALATHMFWKEHEYSAALTNAYREATADVLRQHEQERSALVDLLITGGYGEHGSAWEVASRLELPTTGAFVTVAAEVVALGSVTMPGIASKLRAINVSSVWRLLPDIEVGIVSISTADLAEVEHILARAAPARVGISPVHDALGEVPRALYLARVALSSVLPGAPRLHRFDDTPLATLVAAAPDAATRIAKNVLGQLLELRREEQDALLDTLEAWLAAGGSTTATAERLFLHPNTVRHRLRRIAAYTGRDLDQPIALAELATALHALRLLPDVR